MGSISANFGASSAYTVVLEWTEAARDVAANRTEVDFACRLLSNRATAAFHGPGPQRRLFRRRPDLHLRPRRLHPDGKRHRRPLVEARRRGP